MTRILSTAFAVVVCGLVPSIAAAQSRNLVAEMQGYANALGVSCEFCHVAPPNSDLRNRRRTSRAR